MAAAMVSSMATGLMSGRAASCTATWVVPAGTALPYVVSLENPADSRTAVSSIRIVQELDAELDVRSFRLSDVYLPGRLNNVRADSMLLCDVYAKKRSTASAKRCPTRTTAGEELIP